MHRVVPLALQCLVNLHGRTQVGLSVDLDLSITKGRHVVLVEDIVDTGLTLQMLKKHLLEVGVYL